MRHSPLLIASLIGCAALLAGKVSLAEAPTNTAAAVVSRSVRPRIESTATQPLDAQSGRDWGLSSHEWTRYQHLMQGPLGIWSPDLDPLTALGIEARSDAERARYAQLEVRMEGERVAKILSFQRAYDAAWKRLYPNLEPVNLASVEPHSTASATDHLAVFVKEPCPACLGEVRALQAQARAFDIYMVGLETDADIRTWASRVGIDPTKVRAGTITLNHDAGRWLAIGDSGPLPAVLFEVNGQWHRE